MVKCIWCGREEKYKRDNVRYVCISCSVYTHIGYEISQKIKDNSFGIKEVKDMVENMLETNRRMDNAEEKFAEKEGK